MAIEPLDSSYQQSILFGPHRATDLVMREPNRPQGVTVDPGQQPEDSKDALNTDKNVTNRSRKSPIDEGTEQLNQPRPEVPFSRLLLFDEALSTPRPQLSTPDIQNAANITVQADDPKGKTDPLRQADEVATAISTKKDLHDSFERGTKIAADPEPNAVFEFVRADFDRPNNPEYSSQEDNAENISTYLQRGVDPSNFDNVVITTGRIDRDEARVLDNPLPANELEQPIDDLDIPFNQVGGVERDNPTKMAEYRAFEDRARENPITERDDDSDFGERPNNLEVIGESIEFTREQQRLNNPEFQDVAVQREAQRNIDRDLGRTENSSNSEASQRTEALSASPQSQTTFDRPVNPLSGTNSNPQEISVETATTGFRDLEAPEARRPRVISALLGTPENMIERMRVVDRLPVEADDIYGLDSFVRADILGIPADSVVPLGGLTREPGETYFSSTLERVSATPHEQTNPAPSGPEVNAERSDEVTREEERTRYEQVTVTYNEIASAQDFVYRAEPNVGTHFFFFA